MLDPIIAFKDSGLGQFIALVSFFFVPLFWSIIFSTLNGNIVGSFLKHALLPSYIATGIFFSLGDDSIIKILVRTLLVFGLMFIITGFLTDLFSDKDISYH